MNVRISLSASDRWSAVIAVEHFSATHSGILNERQTWADFASPEDASRWSAYANSRGWSARPSRLFPERNRVVVTLPNIGGEV